MAPLLGLIAMVMSLWHLVPIATFALFAVRGAVLGLFVMPLAFAFSAALILVVLLAPFVVLQAHKRIELLLALLQAVVQQNVAAV